MLRHQQNSPMSLSVKSEGTTYGADNAPGADYESKYSLLSHQQQHRGSPVSLTVKSESHNYSNSSSAGDDYENKLSMLGHRQQNSPVSLTTKNCSTSPSSSSISSNGETGEYDPLSGHPQDSPMSLTTKSSADHHSHHMDSDMDRGGHRPKPNLSPVSLTVKCEPSTAFISGDMEEYEDVPTDLSMDTDRDRQSRDDE